MFFAFFSPRFPLFFPPRVPARCFSPWFCSSSFSFSSHLSHTPSSLSWSFSLLSSSYSSLFVSRLYRVSVDFLPVLLPSFILFCLSFLCLFTSTSSHPVCCPLSVLSTSPSDSPRPPTPPPPLPSPFSPSPLTCPRELWLSFVYTHPPPLFLHPCSSPLLTPRHSQSVQRDELEWHLGQERGVEPQSKSQGWGQPQSRGAAGLTRYNRPLALRAEVSAPPSPLLHLPFHLWDWGHSCSLTDTRALCWLLCLLNLENYSHCCGIQLHRLNGDKLTPPPQLCLPHVIFNITNAWTSLRHTSFSFLIVRINGILEQQNNTTEIILIYFVLLQMRRNSKM